MCKIDVKHTLDVTFLDCLALTFCDIIGDLLREWACLFLLGGTTFRPTSNLADIPVLRVRMVTVSPSKLKILHFMYMKFGRNYGQTDGRTDRLSNRQRDNVITLNMIIFAG